MDSDEPQQPAVGEPAGQQLKKARESHGLSQKDIADAQHLRVSIIQAIEDGNYQQIDSELFLKGYVRAYAKQVGADADALIQTLDLELEPLRREKDKQEQENPLVDIERRRLKKRRVAKTLGIIVVLAGIAFAGWKLVLEPRMAGDNLTGDRQQSNEVSDTSEASETNDMESEVELTEEPVPGQEASVNAEQEQAPEIEEVYGIAEVPELANGDASAGSEGVESQSPEGQSSEVVSSDEIGTDGGGVENEVAAVETVVQPDPVFEESAQPQSVAAQTQLEMSFVSDCWVQVTDSSGARLVASLQREGDQISVSGRAPMEVVIGAVDAVSQVSFAGEPVNLSSFRVVNNRTEFTLTL